MNPISYSLDQISRAIPLDILEKTFISIPFGREPNEPTYQTKSRLPVSLDERIRFEVIETWVKVDCDLVGGTEIEIPLERVERQIVDMFNYIYRVPKMMTNGRRIIRPLSIGFGEGAVLAGSNLAPSRGNALLDAASGLLNSSLPIPIVNSAQIHLIGENTILVNDNIALPMNIYLRCWLENDDNFNHIQSTSYPAFAKMVVLAVKAHIYNKMAIPMDRGVIYAGNELGRFKEIIDSYSDCYEQYCTYRDEIWRKTAIMNDYKGHTRLLRRTLGGGH